MIRELVATFCVLTVTSGQWNTGWNTGRGAWRGAQSWNQRGHMTRWGSQDETDNLRATCSFFHKAPKFSIEGRITLKRRSNRWSGSRPELKVHLKLNPYGKDTVTVTPVITEIANVDGYPMCTPENLGDIVTSDQPMRNNRHHMPWGHMPSRGNALEEIELTGKDVFKETYTDVPIPSVKEAFGLGFALCTSIESEEEEDSSVWGTGGSLWANPWRMPMRHSMESTSRCTGHIFGCCKFGRSDRDAIEPRRCGKYPLPDA